MQWYVARANFKKRDRSAVWVAADVQDFFK